MPEADAARMAKLGDVIRMTYTPRGATSMKADDDGRVVLADLDRSTLIAGVLAMEDIAHGQRVRRFTIDARLPDGTWHTLAAGQSIGHKRIVTFAPLRVDALRLSMPDPVARPMIRTLTPLA